jgi:hypothetical protein
VSEDHCVVQLSPVSGSNRRVTFEVENHHRLDGVIYSTYLTSPNAAGKSAVIAPPKSSTCLNSDIFLVDVFVRRQSRGGFSSGKATF